MGEDDAGPANPVGSALTNDRRNLAAPLSVSASATYSLLNDLPPCPTTDTRIDCPHVR
jgi:hypothetical protein